MKLSKTIIQGDTYTTKIRLKNNAGQYISHEEINHIYFTSEKAQIKKEAIYSVDDECHILSFTSEETSALKPCTYTFDITVDLYNGATIKTLNYEGDLLVLAKHNKID